MNKFSNYEKYDNLNINKKYDVNKIQILFSDIISILDLIDNYINFLNADISNNSSKSNLGLNIDNFIFTLENNYQDMSNKLKLFYNYLQFFMKIHQKYLKSFITKIQLTYNQTKDSIKLNVDILNDKLSVSLINFNAIDKAVADTNNLINEYNEPLFEPKNKSLKKYVKNIDINSDNVSDSEEETVVDYFTSQPVSKSKIKPEPEPEPEQEQVSELNAEPEQVSEPKSDPVSNSSDQPEPVSEPNPEPVSEPKPEPVSEPVNKNKSKSKKDKLSKSNSITDSESTLKSESDHENIEF